jgi:steroid 5-alpha reductase family enzyme
MPKQQSALFSITVVLITVVLGALLALAGSQDGWRVSGPSSIAGFALAVILAYVVQWIVYIHAAAKQTDRYFDATGAFTYIAVTTLLLVLSPGLDLRSLILGAVVIIWAARLGSFLFARNRRSGRDDRFDEIKKSKLRFLSVWTLQGLWVSLTAAAAWIAISSENQAPTDWTTWLGLVIWVVGFGIEVTADMQKNRFKADPSNQGAFIQTGLWSISRHPNYFGEILLWIGVLVIAAPVLQGWQLVALLSPVFVTLLLTRVSGIPLLEEKAQLKWGDDPEYQAYRARTSVLLPLPNRKV